MGDSFIIVNKSSAGAVSGVFAQLNGNATPMPEGTIFTFASQAWQISYLADDGNDVRITPIPEPNTLLLLGLSIAGAVGYRWKKHAGTFARTRLPASSVRQRDDPQ